MRDEIDAKVLELEIGKTYKVFDISEMMACTTSRIIVIRSKDADGRFIFSEPRKRKQYYFSARTSTLIIPVPLQKGILLADSETGSFSGNALLNFIGSADEVRRIIDTENLNPWLDKSIIVAKLDDKEVPVYPDIAEANKQNHAVMARILEG